MYRCVTSNTLVNVLVLYTVRLFTSKSNSIAASDSNVSVSISIVQVLL